MTAIPRYARNDNCRYRMISFPFHVSGQPSRTEGSFYMSGMRDMLGIALYRDVSARHEPK